MLQLHVFLKAARKQENNKVTAVVWEYLLLVWTQRSFSQETVFVKAPVSPARAEQAEPNQSTTSPLKLYTKQETLNQMKLD